jgi:hypothetical protein
MAKDAPVKTADAIQRHLESRGNGSLPVGDVTIETYKGLVIVGVETRRGDSWQAEEPTKK